MTELKSIWHTADEAPEAYADIAFYVDGYLYFASYQPQYNQYGIFGADKVEKWCYVKELSSYILALETELDHTRKALEQSEICCTEWEKQALDYKAENIALSGDLERTRKAFDVAKDTIRHADWFFDGDYNVDAKTMHNEIKYAIKAITALEQKE